ncbi:hypothetical protein SMD44_p10098 (plasmid) [Streptomyces alboflavus]|uniref:Uncharacterized protein n=1 Tax=Streptomyces alboflavus TaxID=67267 RepID=A0A291W3W2_9ACTN|nr:hypothetical protein [Streptomyces alboflavus]ATM24597.1 hypothetical protein SMD44_p10098 [Streptomyces alboflavus]
MTTRAPILKRAEELAAAIRSLAEYQDREDWLTFHPDTEDLISRRGTSRDQLNYSVPEALDLKQRVATYCLENPNPGAGNLVAAVLDSFLRASGYPPSVERLPSSRT